MNHLISNLLIVDVAEVSLTDDILNKIKGPRAEGIRERMQEDSKLFRAYKLTYMSQGHRVKGFIVEPNEGEKLPCIIFNRGGSKDFSIWTDDHVFRFMGYYAARGYLCITSQLSGCDGGEGKDEFGGAEVADVLALKDILEQHPRADITRIGMEGASRGGMMTYRVLSQVDWVKAAVVRAGVSQVAHSYTLRPSLKEWHSDMYDVNNEGELAKRSAVCWPERFCKTTPLLLIHGSADNRVPVADTLVLTTKLIEHKVPCRLVIFEGADHYISEFKKDEYKLTLEWFDRYVKNGEPLPNLEPHGE